MRYGLTVIYCCLLAALSSCAGDTEPPLPLIGEAGRGWYSEKAFLLDEDSYTERLRALYGEHARTLSAAPPAQTEITEEAAGALARMLHYEIYARKEGDYGTLLYLAGALTGFSSQMAAREIMLKKKGALREETLFTVIRSRDGKRYFFGNMIDLPLFDSREGSVSAWRLITETAGISAEETPQPREAAARAARDARAGGAVYALPHVAHGFRPEADVFTLTNMYWNPVRNYLLTRRIPPLQWPETLGRAAALLLKKTRNDSPDAVLSVYLLLEGITRGAHISPQGVHNARFAPVSAD